MNGFDLSKIYGFKSVEAKEGEAINLRTPETSGRLGAKRGIVIPGGEGL